MCGRYLLTSPVESIRRIFGVDTRVNIPARYNIAPTQPVLVVRRGESGRRELAPVRWGLVPSWLKELPRDRPVINARIETVREKPFFRSAIKYRRCLVPADGFYEWQKIPGGKRPMLIRLRGAPLFAFAGITEVWHGPDGGDLFESMAILTMASNTAIAPLHHRMPVIVNPGQYGDWLSQDGKAGIVDELEPIDPDEFDYYEVSKRVNNVRNDDEACVLPISKIEPKLL